ncbi:MAG: RNA-binding protein [Hydrogenophilales bacterium 28-61-23]|nr:MAG: RNA-binding protein [Hydrogenophilales bacterium 28-61-23]
MTDSIRLAKRVAELRACSRREAEQIITGGWVRVDGIVIEEPQFRVAEQHIEIAAEASPAQAEPVTLLLNKPIGHHTGEGDGEHAASRLLNVDTLWAEADPSFIARPIRPLKMHFAQLTACVPLETGASGLVVFSQDWRIVRKLTEDAATVEHEIVLEVAGDLTPDGLKRLNQGIAFQGRTPASIKASWQNETRLRIALKGARAGQIAHMCEAVGLRVLSMKRIRLGGVSMGKLPPGQWRYLRGNERF